jgi:hypothetical protein
MSGCLDLVGGKQSYHLDCLGASITCSLTFQVSFLTGVSGFGFVRSQQLNCTRWWDFGAPQEAR